MTDNNRAVLTGQQSAEALIEKAIENNVPVDTMERLLAMRRELKQEWAKEQFDRAMAAFQSECPTIQKTKEVKTRGGIVAYKYAPIESIVEQVKPLLEKHGFSYSVQQRFNEEAGRVKVLCVVKHYDGHHEEYEMEVPLGNKTDIMSQTQVVAAATTFAKRYVFCNAFGILTGDEDTDALPAEKVVSQRVTPPPAVRDDMNRMKIKKLCDNLNPLLQTGDDYRAFVSKQTGLELEEKNYNAIIAKFTEMTQKKSTDVEEIAKVIDGEIIEDKKEESKHAKTMREAMKKATGEVV